jgi:uncharacterized membrane protein
MYAKAEREKTPKVLIVSGVLIALVGVIRIFALITELIRLLTSQYLSSMMTHDGASIVLAFILDIGLTVLVGFAAYGLFRRRTWSFPCTVIAVLCSMLLILLEIFSTQGLALIARIGFLALDVAILVLAGNGKRYLLPRQAGHSA